MSQKQNELTPITRVEFGIFGPDEIRRMSVVEVIHPETFETTNTTEPKVQGLTDPHMGPIEPFIPCESCGLEQEGCWGHFGHIDLVRPVYHPSFLPTVLKCLRCVCHICRRILIHPDDIPEGADLSEIEKIIKNKKTKYSQCGTIGSAGANAKADDSYQSWMKSGCGAKQLLYKKDSYEIYYKPQDKKEVDPVSGKAIKKKAKTEDDDDDDDDKDKRERPDKMTLFTAERALEVLENVSDDDLKLLGFHDLSRCRPSWMITSVIPVPPPTVRPSVLMEASKRSEDDLTFKLAEIIKSNNTLRKQQNEGAKTDDIMASLSLVQYHWATYIANDFPKKGISQQRSHRPVKCLLDRLAGKQGRFRTNLMGKRVDQSSRTVVGPDPGLSIEEIGVPLAIAKTLTFPEVVNERNIHVMYQLIQNGPSKHPGARIVHKLDGTEIDLKYCSDSIRLEPGDIVDRHMIDGDPVINNRQPSLHKMSMMGHCVRVMPYSTFRMSLAVTTPYNADFDGDEMNIHAPQSYEARAEIENLLMVPFQVISPKNSGPVIGIIQDALLGSSKLTKKNTFITREFFMQICMQIDDFDGNVPEPAIMKPVELWTGKQVVSLILPKTLYMKKQNNTYNAKKGDNLWNQVTKDSLVIIERGQLLTGVLDKKTLGISGGSIIHIVFKDYGAMRCKMFLNQIQFIANYWLLHTGFSVGISDCILEKMHQNYIQGVIIKAIETVNHILETEKYDKNVEQKVNKILNAAATDVGSYIKENLPLDNALYEMVTCGSKGNPLNLVQMMGLVGQQNVSGKRVPLGYSGRSVPHVKMGDQGPEARGFVKNPYYDGLTPLEMFFHTMGGREGLVDTAIKTADTGYTTRRLIKAMEDLIVRNDGTVRNSSEHIVQFQYGEDNLDPCSLEHQGYDSLNGNALFEWSDEELQEQYSRAEKYMPSIMTPPRFAASLAAEAKQLSEDHSWLMDYFARKSEKTVMVPVNIDRLVKRVKYGDVKLDDPKNIFEMDTEFMLNPIYITAQIELLKMAIFTRTLPSGIHDYRENMLFSMLLRDKLHPRRILYQYKLTLHQFHCLLEHIRVIYLDSFVQAGEMTGTIAAQSIGEPAQQMTLNSVSWDTKIVVNVNGVDETKQIGEWIDKLMNTGSVTTLENGTEYLELSDIVTVPTVDADGIFSIGGVTAVTRHPPGGDLVKVTTQSGKNVIATRTKSLLIWDGCKFNHTAGADAKIGDCMPVVFNDYNKHIYSNFVNDVALDPIVSIEHISQKYHPHVYDLTVPSTTNFVIENALALADTFHSAGVSSRNVTLGVPRLTEIINCSKKPKTPSITIYLKPEYASNKETVKNLKSMLCHTTLGDLLDPTECRSAVANYITEPIEPYMEDFYQLQFTPEEVAQFCPWMIRLKFIPDLLDIKGLNIISISQYIESKFNGDVKCIYSDPNASQCVVHIHMILPGAVQMSEEETINFFKEIYGKLRELLICGTTGIEKAYIIRDQFAENEWVIETEGTNLQEILNHPMIDATRTISNHPMEVQEILGIEAAHQSIIDQIRGVIDQYGIDVQYRHLSVLANVMTKDGDMMAITRHGINRREDSSPLTKATFEETGDMVFEAAIGALRDNLQSVSSRLIMGLPTKLGTGFCELVVDPQKPDWNELLRVGKLPPRVEEYDEDGEQQEMIMSPQANRHNSYSTRNNYSPAVYSPVDGIDYSPVASPVSSSPRYSPSSPRYSPSSPKYSPSSPRYSSSSPKYSPSSPKYSPSSPKYSSSSPKYSPTSSPKYSSSQPAYTEVQYDPEAPLTPEPPEPPKRKTAEFSKPYSFAKNPSNTTQVKKKVKFQGQNNNHQKNNRKQNKRKEPSGSTDIFSFL